VNFLNVLGAQMILFCKKCIFANLHWLNNFSWLFLSFLQITSGVYSCILIQVYWHAACIALKVVGAVLVGFLRRWIKFAQFSSQWEARADAWRNVPSPADQ
jgi:hypothetical protein